MSDRYIEKTFLYLLGCSLLIHLIVGALVLYLPASKPPLPKEPVFIDLQQIPAPQVETPLQQETPRPSDHQRKVERETTPRGSGLRDSGRIVPPVPASRPQPLPPSTPRETMPLIPNKPLPVEPKEDQVPAGSSAASLLKRRPLTPPQPKIADLYPRSKTLAKIESQIFKEFEDEIEEGKIRRLDTFDITYGSFMRRLDAELVRTYSERKDVNNQLAGVPDSVAIVIMYFDKNGDVVLDKTRIIRSSGYKGMDDFVLDSIKKIGPLGKLPKENKDEGIQLIMGFHYLHLLRAVN